MKKFHIQMRTGKKLSREKKNFVLCKDISNYEGLKEKMLAFLKEYTMPLLEQLTCEKII